MMRHQLLHDVRHYWRLLIALGIAAAIQAGIDAWTGLPAHLDSLRSVLNISVLGALALLICLAVRDTPPHRHDAYWRTLPIRPFDLWLCKVVFTAIAVLVVLIGNVIGWLCCDAGASVTTLLLLQTRTVMEVALPTLGVALLAASIPQLVIGGIIVYVALPLYFLRSQNPIMFHTHPAVLWKGPVLGLILILVAVGRFRYRLGYAATLLAIWWLGSHAVARPPFKYMSPPMAQQITSQPLQPAEPDQPSLFQLLHMPTPEGIIAVPYWLKAEVPAHGGRRQAMTAYGPQEEMPEYGFASTQAILRASGWGGGHGNDINLRPDPDHLPQGDFNGTVAYQFVKLDIVMDVPGIIGTYTQGELQLQVHASNAITVRVPKHHQLAMRGSPKQYGYGIDSILAVLVRPGTTPWETNPPVRRTKVMGGLCDYYDFGWNSQRVEGATIRLVTVDHLNSDHQSFSFKDFNFRQPSNRPIQPPELPADASLGERVDAILYHEYSRDRQQLAAIREEKLRELGPQVVMPLLARMPLPQACFPVACKIFDDWLTEEHHELARQQTRISSALLGYLLQRGWSLDEEVVLWTKRHSAYLGNNILSHAATLPQISHDELIWYYLHRRQYGATYEELFAARQDFPWEKAKQAKWDSSLARESVNEALLASALENNWPRALECAIVVIRERNSLHLAAPIEGCFVIPDGLPRPWLWVLQHHDQFVYDPETKRWALPPETAP